jgi:membrane-associated progesterone receptor component
VSTPQSTRRWTTSSNAWPKRHKNTRPTPPRTLSLPLSSLLLSKTQAANPSINPRRTALLTPLNLALLALLLYTLFAILRPASSSSAAASALPKEPPATVFRTFTPRTLLPNNGEAGAPVYLAVRGRVFDVTPGRNFYGPGGMYANFAGRDASRGLACHSFDVDMLTEDLDGPLDKLDDLGRDEMEALRDWEARFESKYMVVGRLVAAGEEKA